MIQETLSDELTLTRQVRLHARIAKTLEELYGENAETHAAGLAHHFASATAGERALSTYAYEGAITNFEKGLVARGITLPVAEAAADEEIAAFLFSLGRAQAATAERLETK